MNGRQWRLFTPVNGTFEPFAGAREESFSLDNKSVDRSGKERDGARHLLVGVGRTCDLSLAMRAKRGPGLDAMRNAVANNQLIRIRAYAWETVVDGFFHPGSYRESAPSAQAISINVSLASSGLFLLMFGADALLLSADKAFDMTLNDVFRNTAGYEI